MPAPFQPDALPGSPEPESGLSAGQREAALEELQRVVDSEVFRSSKRCQEFLRYVVEQAVNGRAELLKERTIGVELFHRGPSYEPNADAIVRVRATEVRKRLVQYYDRLERSPEMRITLGTGTYVPEFQWAAATSSEAEPAPPARPEAATLRLRWMGLAFAAVLLAAAGWLVWRQFTPAPSALYDFWKPTLASPNPVLICLGQPVVYHLSRRVHENYLATQPPGRVPGPYVIPLKPGQVEASDILPVPDQYVGVGTAQAAASLSARLAFWGKRSQIRVGNDFSFYDLKNYPAVLEGAFSNDWTMKLTRRMPFAFFQEGSVRGIREQVAPHRVWHLRALQPDGKTTEDYALIARAFDTGTMEPLIEVAGITQYGTQAAGEFLTNETAFSAAMAGAPPDWRTRNLQILLHLEVIGKTPGKPRVVAVRVW